MRHSRRTLHAFTLIEIIVALAIFALVTMMVTVGLHHIIGSKSHLAEHDVQFEAMQKSLVIMRRDFSQKDDAVHVKTRSKVDPDVLYQQDKITFYRMGDINPFAYFPRGNVQKVSYQTTGHTLRRVSGHSSQALFSNVSNVLFDYFDDKDQSYSEWPPKQDDTENKITGDPMAMSVTILFNTGVSLKQIYLFPGAFSYAA